MAVYCGMDFHSRQQFVMWCDTHDGEIHERQLTHQSLDDVRSFYSQFTGEVIVGIEAGGYSEWFETMLQELGHQVWIGNATEIRRRARSRQKTDRRDAQLLLDLLLKGEFPRISRPSRESLEVLRRLRYRHRLVQLRTAMRNSLQVLALGSGLVLKAKLRTKQGRQKLGELPLSPALSQQRADWSELIAQVEERIARVERELAELAVGDERVRRLRTHPGIGLLTGLALVHTLRPRQPLCQQPEGHRLGRARTPRAFFRGEAADGADQQSRLAGLALPTRRGRQQRRQERRGFTPAL